MLLLLPSPLSHALGFILRLLRGSVFAATTYFEGNRNPFENWPLVVVVVILVVINYSYNESLWLPLEKTYVSNEITSNFVYLLFAKKRKFNFHFSV